MTAPVTVLAVIDREIARAGGDFYSDGRDLIEARAAVDELIEASYAISNYQWPKESEWQRFRDALVRCGGE